MTARSSFAVAADLFTAPTQAFAAIKENPNAFLPLVVVLALQALTNFAYTNAVDLPWLFETQLLSSNAPMTEAQREQAVAAATNLSPTVYGAIGAVTGAIFLVIAFFIVALYYTAISFFTNDGIKLKQWFAFVCWCSLPVGLGLLASLVNVLATDARFMLQEEMNPLAFGNLFSIDTTNANVIQRILLSLDLTALWAVVLAVLGYQAWTQRSLLKTVAVVLGPLVCIVLIGTLIALL